MTPRERLGLDLAREIVTFLGDVSMPTAAGDQRERFSRVLAQELDDETMEALRMAFAARNARARGPGRRGR